MEKLIKCRIRMINILLFSSGLRRHLLPGNAGWSLPWREAAVCRVSRQLSWHPAHPVVFEEWRGSGAAPRLRRPGLRLGWLPEAERDRSGPWRLLPWCKTRESPDFHLTWKFTRHKFGKITSAHPWKRLSTPKLTSTSWTKTSLNFMFYLMRFLAPCFTSEMASGMRTNWFDKCTSGELSHLW